MNMIKYMICGILGYLIGSFSFSITISRLVFHEDVRSQGSRNAGATNMARSFGVLPGVLTLVGDMLKAFAAVALGRLLCGETGLAVAGIACIIGHCYPVYYGFRGGKGVSAGIALVFCADWRAGIIAVLAFALTVTLTKKVSPASILGAVAAAVFCAFFGARVSGMIMAVFTALLVIIRHKENIRRLISGTEPDFRFKK